MLLACYYLGIKAGLVLEYWNDKGPSASNGGPWCPFSLSTTVNLSLQISITQWQTSRSA